MIRYLRIDQGFGLVRPTLSYLRIRVGVRVQIPDLSEIDQVHFNLSHLTPRTVSTA
jgi:hypothetical protein